MIWSTLILGSRQYLFTEGCKGFCSFLGIFFFGEGCFVLCLFFFPWGSLGPLFNDFGTLFSLKFRIIVMSFLRAFCHRKQDSWSSAKQTLKHLGIQISWLSPRFLTPMSIHCGGNRNKWIMKSSLRCVHQEHRQQILSLSRTCLVAF